MLEIAMKIMVMKLLVRQQQNMKVDADGNEDNAENALWKKWMMMVNI